MKVILISCLVLAAIGCNNADHAGHDTPTDTSKTAMDHMDHMKPADNEMKALMNDMMMQMHQAKPTGDNDVDYASMMASHHKTAVEMAKLELAKGKDDSLKTFAQDIITAQLAEINIMDKFIAEHSIAVSPDTKTFQTAMQESMAAMMNAEPVVYNDTDKDFIAQMIPHHQSAVDMAKAYLKYGKNAELVKLSNNIVQSQEKEISWMKGRLK